MNEQGQQPHFGGPLPGQGMKKTGKWTSIIGALLLVLSVGGAIIMGVSGVKTVSDTLEEDVEQVAPQQTVHLEEGMTRLLLHVQGAPEPTCRVEPAPGSTGSADLSAATGENTYINIAQGETTYTAFAAIEAHSSGDFLLDCQAEESAKMVMTQDVTDMAGSLGLLGGALLLGFLGGGLGFLLLVIGLVLFFVGRSKMKR